MSVPPPAPQDQAVPPDNVDPPVPFRMECRVCGKIEIGHESGMCAMCRLADSDIE